jgi:hypothetical protein
LDTTTVASVRKKGERQWLNSHMTLNAVGIKAIHWSKTEHNDLAKLAQISPVYLAWQTTKSRPQHPRHNPTICPDSGATSIMGPHLDMFSEYVELCDKGIVVCLGDEDKIIPIAGRGNLSINMLGHTIAYVDALHIPNLSVILLPARVHQCIMPGCSFVANHSGCFLTYPNFTIEVDDFKRLHHPMR